MTINEMKAINKAKGGFYFTPDTVKFWNSKIHTAPNRYNLFIESHDSFNREYRLYCVKHFSPITGDIETIENAETAKTYEHFETLASAKAFMHKLTIALNNATKCYRENAVINDIAKVTEEGYNSGIFTLENSKGDTIQINTNNFDRFICG